MSTTVTYKGETLTTVENQTRTLLTSGKYLEDDLTLVDISRGEPSLQAKSNIAPTTSSQTITPDSGYDGLSSVQINAMPTGTAGTPSATKGTVSNHAVSVTPSVTNTTGYITGDTKTGTAVSVTASELLSGTKSITENGTGIDVTNYASVDVNVSGGGVEMVTITASAMQGIIDHSNWKIPPNATVEIDPDQPWIATITTPKESMIANGPSGLNRGLNVSGLTSDTVTIVGQPRNYFFFFYVGTTNGAIYG